MRSARAGQASTCKRCFLLDCITASYHIPDHMLTLKNGRILHVAGIYSRETYAHPDWNLMELNGPNEAMSREILEASKNVFGRTTAYYCNIAQDFDLKKIGCHPISARCGWQALR